jgi:hypothetical protein
VREFQRAQEALRQVTSWKVEGRLAASDSSAGEYVVEVSCPSSERTTRHIRPSASQSGAREFTLEEVAIGNDRYTRISWANRWTRLPSVGTAATVACAYLQRLQDAPGLPPLQRWLNGSYVIEKENVRETSDGKCREWKVVTPGGFSSAANTDFVCLGVKDHLPKSQGAPGSWAEVRFYDWNVPNEIVAPALTDAP